MAQIAFPIHRSNLPFCLRKILAASSWKQLHGAGGSFEFKRSRWDLHALLNVALLMALDDAPTLGERFEKARETYSALYPKRRQCGQTMSGLLSAQKEIPEAVHATLRSVLQQRMGTEAARCGRWHAFGVDGTHQNAPRTQSNEQHLGTVSKEPAVPQLTIVAAVALAQRVIWDWAVGKAADSERALALQVIERLPENALVVGDAGMSGYAWTQAVLNAGCHVLLRVGANVALWAEQVAGAKLKGGEVWLWPESKRGQAPLRLRLICLRSRRHKPVYLLTDILDERALSAQQARELYGLRWPASEGAFRDWKCTLEKDTLRSRAAKQARQECEFSLHALMLLQTLALAAVQKRQLIASIAQAQRVWRAGIRQHVAGRSTRQFVAQMRASRIDDYKRRAPKAARRWPKRKDHAPPNPPQILELTEGLKRRGLAWLEAAEI